jgi:hypothetical protein
MGVEYFLIGSLSKLFASFVTYPFSLIKTRFQVHFVLFCFRFNNSTFWKLIIACIFLTLCSIVFFLLISGWTKFLSHLIFWNFSNFGKNYTVCSITKKKTSLIHQKLRVKLLHSFLFHAEWKDSKEFIEDFSSMPCVLFRKKLIYLTWNFCFFYLFPNFLSVFRFLSCSFIFIRWSVLTQIFCCNTHCLRTALNINVIFCSINKKVTTNKQNTHQWFDQKERDSHTILFSILQKLSISSLQ